jgi:hypothetical protein
MASTNRVQAYIIGRVELMDVPIALPKYMKPEEEWAIPGVPDYYSLNDIDGTDILGYRVEIRKSLDGWFVYSDSDMSYRFGWYDHFEQMAQDYFGDVGTGETKNLYILTTQAEIDAEMSGTAGDHQIAQWPMEKDEGPSGLSCETLCKELCERLGLGNDCVRFCTSMCKNHGRDAVKHCERVFNGKGR